MKKRKGMFKIYRSQLGRVTRGMLLIAWTAGREVRAWIGILGKEAWMA